MVILWTWLAVVALSSGVIWWLIHTAPIWDDQDWE